jgi:hypothetical protein
MNLEIKIYARFRPYCMSYYTKERGIIWDTEQQSDYFKPRSSINI